MQSCLLLAPLVKFEKPRKNFFQVGYDILWNLVIGNVQEPHLGDGLVELLEEFLAGIWGVGEGEVDDGDGLEV